MKPLSISLVFLCCTTHHCLAGEWIDDFVTNSLTATSTTSSGPISFRSSERNYISYGSFSARYPVSTDYPITVSPPRLKIGCGGIDAWAGGLSYIDDPAYYVAKLQGALRSAAFIAFDMALKNMCQACSDAMATAENLAAKINAINLDECAMGKSIVTVLKESRDPDVQSTRTAEIAQERMLDPALGGAKNPSEVHASLRSNNGAADSTAKLNEALDACPTEFKDIYKSGSVIGNIADKIGIAAHKEIIRGYIGDVNIAFDNTTNNFTFDSLRPCSRNTSLDLDALVWGEAQKRRLSDDTCVVDASTTLVNQAKTHLTNLAATYKSPNQAPNTAAESFVALVPLQINSNIKAAVIQGAESDAIALMAEPVAILYAGRALHDLLDRADEIIKYGIEAAEKTGVNGAGSVNNCRRELVAPAVEYLRALRPRMWEMRKAARGQMNQKLQEIYVSLSVALAEESRYKDAKGSVIKNVVDR